MNYQKMHIRRFIIFYILTFGLLSSILLTLFAFLFGLNTIQKRYTQSYVQTTFQTFDANLNALVKNYNLILLDIASGSQLLEAMLHTKSGLTDITDQVQNILSLALSGYDDIKQLDIVNEAGNRYTCITHPDEQDAPLPLPPESFLKTLSASSLCLYEYTIQNQVGNPFLVFGRNSSIGKIIIYIPENIISQLYEANSLKNSSQFLSINGRIVSCSDISYIGFPSDLAAREKSTHTLFGGSAVYSHKIQIIALKDTLSLTYIVSNEDLYQTTGNLNRALLAALTLAVAVCLLLVLLVTKRLIYAIRELKQNLHIFSENYTHTIESHEDSELAELEQQFIYMSERIRTLIAHNKKAQHDKHVAELRALQSQINPHFIYNSIDAIVWMTKIQEPYADIEKLARSLAAFFRLGLHGGESIITIEDELAHVESYLEIEQIRFPQLFDVEICVENELRSLKIIKIILQPLVENAINHGFNNIGRKGHITLQIHPDPDNPNYVHFIVQDNGRGFILQSGEFPKRSKCSGSGYGLKNVNDRLILEYGTDAALSFNSTPDVGTTVSFRIRRDFMR